MPKAENKKRKLAEKPAPKKVKEEEPESEESEKSEEGESEEVEEVEEKSPKKTKSENVVPKPKKDLSNVKTLVANISQFFTEDELKKHFSQGGKVKKLLYDRCFVEFESPEEAKKAAEVLQDRTIRGFMVRVSQKELLSDDEVNMIGLTNFPSPITVAEIRAALEVALGDSKSHLENVFFVSPYMVAASFDSHEIIKSVLPQLNGNLKVKDTQLKASLLGPKFNWLTDPKAGKDRRRQKMFKGSSRPRRGKGSPIGGNGKSRGSENVKKVETS